MDVVQKLKATHSITAKLTRMVTVTVAVPVRGPGLVPSSVAMTLTLKRLTFSWSRLNAESSPPLPIMKLSEVFWPAGSSISREY